MERGAVIQDIVSVLGRADPVLQNSRTSVTTQIAALVIWLGRKRQGGRRLVQESRRGWCLALLIRRWLLTLYKGIVPLVIEVHDADIMATLIILKPEVEEKIGSRMRMVFSGATESHILAREIRDFFHDHS